MQIKPEVSTHTTRFAFIKAGDGHEYQVARGGLGARGQKMDALQEQVSELSKDGKASEAYAPARELFIVAMSPFYLKETIERLLDEDHFGWPDYVRLREIINGDELADGQKKSSAELTLTQQTGEQSSAGPAKP